MAVDPLSRSEYRSSINSPVPMTSLMRRAAHWICATLTVTVTAAAGAVCAPAHAQTNGLVGEDRLASAWMRELPAGPGPAVICMVDSGAHPHPRVVDAPYGAHYTPADPLSHADLMVDDILNIWPAATIIDAPMIDGAADPLGDAMSYCAQQTDAAVVMQAVTVLGTPYVTEQQAAAAIVQTHSYVVSAGNRGAVEWPATLPGVVAVGAVDLDDALCGFSPADVTVVAAGCPSRSGFEGTSPATAQVSALLAALRSWRPDLTASSAHELMTNTARATPGGHVPDAEAMFAAAGLADIVADAKDRVAAIEDPYPAEPIVRSVRRVGDRIIVRVSYEPDARLIVDAGRRQIIVRGPRFEIRARRWPKPFTVTACRGGGGCLPSDPVHVPRLDAGADIAIDAPRHAAVRR